MTISDAGNIQEMRVWVMTPIPSKPQLDPPSYTFPWSWGSFVEHKRLIVTRHASLPGAMGSADFKLLRNVIDDNAKLGNNHPFIWDEITLPLVPGQYVFVTAGTLADVKPGTVLDYTKVKWFGFIDQIDGDQLSGTTELIGTVSALEVGVLLDRMQARGWAKAGPTNNSQNATPISSPESANIGGKVDGQIIGNAVFNSAYGCYLFQNDPAQCSSIASAYFTRWRLFKHMVQNCFAASSIITGVTWQVSCLDGSQADQPTGNTIAGYLNSTLIPEVFKLRNQSCKGMLDLLIPRPFGFGWTIGLAAGDQAGTVAWKIIVYTYSEGGGYGLPSFSAYAQPIDLGNLPVLNWHRHTSSIDVPDEVIVEGNQIVFGVTGSYVDGNIGSGWQFSQQETPYRAGASADPGYAALTAVEKLDRNRALRNSPSLSDVFTRYVVTGVSSASSTLDLRRKTTQPGIGIGDDAPMCPEITWDANLQVIAVTSSKSRAPYLPTATLSRTLPWIDGFNSSGIDKRPPYLIPFPSFSTPKLFYYDSTKVVGKQWLDMLARGGVRAGPRIDIDDRGAAIKIAFDAPERMGYGTIAQGVDAIYDTGTAVQQFTWVEGSDGFDWRKVVVTFGIPSDQRISITLRRPGITKDSDVRNSLKITDEKYNLWLMHGGSVMGLFADGTPDRIQGVEAASLRVVRNDFPALAAHANRVAAFSFRRRRGFVYTGMRPDQAWATVGSAISTVTDGTGAVTYNTVVERVECTYGDHPRLVIEADLPSAPNVSGQASPSTGGPVAVTLNGTVSQAVQQVSQDVKKLQADGQRTPLVAAYNPGGSVTPAPNLFFIQGMNPLPGVGLLGIQKRTDTVLGSEMPAGTGGNSGDTIAIAASPSITGVPNGVGLAIRLGTTNGYVWVINDVRSPFAGDLGAGQRMTSGGLQVNLDKVVSGITYRYVCEIPWLAS